MKHIRTFEQYSPISTKEVVNEELFGLGENKEKKEALSKQFDDLVSSNKSWKQDPAKLKDKWMKRAKDEDGFNGKFVVDRGVLQYHSKSKNPMQGKTSAARGL